jgi:hypothetical protein
MQLGIEKRRFDGIRPRRPVGEILEGEDGAFGILRRFVADRNPHSHMRSDLAVEAHFGREHAQHVGDRARLRWFASFDEPLHSVIIAAGETGVVIDARRSGGR